MKKLTTAQRAIAFVAIFLFLGIVVWWSWEKENESEEKVGIEIIEQEDGSRLVRNYDEGFEVEIPEGWRIDGDKKQFYTPDLLGEDGLKISCSSETSEMNDVGEIKKRVLRNLNDVFGNDFEVVQSRFVDNPYKGVEIEIENYLGSSSSIIFLKNDKEYACVFYFDKSDRDKFLSIRDDFLKKLNIYE